MAVTGKETFGVLSTISKGIAELGYRIGRQQQILEDVVDTMTTSENEVNISKSAMSMFDFTELKKSTEMQTATLKDIVKSVDNLSTTTSKISDYQAEVLSSLRAIAINTVPTIVSDDKSSIVIEHNTTSMIGKLSTIDNSLNAIHHDISKKEESVLDMTPKTSKKSNTTEEFDVIKKQLTTIDLSLKSMLQEFSEISSKSSVSNVKTYNTNTQSTETPKSSIQEFGFPKDYLESLSKPLNSIDSNIDVITSMMASILNMNREELETPKVFDSMKDQLSSIDLSLKSMLQDSIKKKQNLNQNSNTASIETPKSSVLESIFPKEYTETLFKSLLSIDSNVDIITSVMASMVGNDERPKSKESTSGNSTELAKLLDIQIRATNVVSTILEDIQESVDKIVLMNEEFKPTPKLISQTEAPSGIGEIFSKELIYQVTKESNNTDVIRQDIELSNLKFDNINKTLLSIFELLQKAPIPKETRSIHTSPEIFSTLPLNIGDAGGITDDSKKIKLADKNLKILANSSIGKNLTKFFESVEFTPDQAESVIRAFDALDVMFVSLEKSDSKKGPKFFDVVRRKASAFDMIGDRFGSRRFKKQIRDTEKQLMLLSKSNIPLYLSEFFSKMEYSVHDAEKLGTSIHKIKIISEISGMGYKLFKAGLVLKMATKLKIGEHLGLIFSGIEESIKDSKKLDSAAQIFTALSSGIIGFALKLVAAVPFLMIGLIAVPILKKVFSGIAIAFSHLGSQEKNIHKGSAALKYVSSALALGILSLVVAGTVIAANPTGVLIGIAAITALSFTFAEIGKHSKNISAGAKSIIHMSGGLALIGLSLFLFSTLMTANPMGVALSIGLLALAVGVFALIGMADKYIKHGSEAVVAMGVGLAIFGLSLFLTSLLVVSNPMGVAMTLGLVVLSGVVFGLLGMAWKEIAKGSIAVALMGLGLLVFGFGIDEFYKSSQKILDGGWEMVGVMSGLLLGTSLIFAGAGLIAGPIIFGAAAMTAVGLSLSVLSLGLMVLSKTDFTKIDAGKFLELGLSIVGVFSAAGIASIFMIPGSIGMIAVGGALMSVAMGVKAFQDANVMGFDIKRAANIISGVGAAFAAVGSDSPAPSLLSMATGINLGKNNVERGIDSVMGANKALTSVAMGLKQFDEYTKDLNFEPPSSDPKNPNLKSIPQRIAIILSMINNEFSAIGASGNSGFSLTKLVFGSDLKKSDVEVGIDSVMNSGKALRSIAEGLKDFDQMTSMLNLSSPDTDPTSIPAKIAIITGIINKVFSDIGASGNTNNSLIGMIFGSDLKKSDVEVGIDSVMQSGDALKSIAMGLVVWGQDDVMGLNFDKIGPNIVKTVGFIRAAFSSIGQDNTDTSIFDFVGLSSPDNNVQTGIESVKGVGDELKNIADGLKIWNSLDSLNLDYDKIGKTITFVLGFIRQGFAAIGGDTQQDSGIFGSLLGTTENKVAKGIESVKGVGDELKGIADALSIYNDLTQGKDGMPPMNLDKVRWNIVSVLSMVREQFAAIGDASGKITLPDGSVVIISNPDAVKRGVDAVNGAGKELKSIADSLVVFDKLTKENMDPISIGNNIKFVLLATREAFAAIGTGTIPKDGPFANLTAPPDNAVKAGIDAVKGAGEELKSIADATKTFVDAQGKDGKGIDNIRSIILGVMTVTVDAFASLSDPTTATRIGRQFVDPSLISTGIETGKIISDGVKYISEIYGNLSNISQNWDSIKSSVSDMLVVPVQSIGKMMEIASAADINAYIVSVINPMSNSLDMMGNVYDRYVTASMKDKRDEKAGGGAIGRFGIDLSKLYKTIQTNLKKENIEPFNILTTNIERLAAIEDPFEKFTKTFKEFVIQTDKFADSINKIDADKMYAYSGFTDAIARIGSVDSKQMKDNIDQFKQLVIEVLARFESAAEASTQASTTNTETTTTTIQNALKPEMLKNAVSDGVSAAIVSSMKELHIDANISESSLARLAEKIANAINGQPH